MKRLVQHLRQILPLRVVEAKINKSIILLILYGTKALIHRRGYYRLLGIPYKKHKLANLHQLELLHHFPKE